MDCGVSIQTATAVKAGGTCIPCARGTRAQIEQAARSAVERRERDHQNHAALERNKAKQRPTFQDFAAEDDPPALLWSFMVGTVFRDEARGEDIDALTPSARILYLTGLFDLELFNGGFSQYFSNNSGEHAHRTVLALRELGAIRRAGLLQRAIDAFPHQRVPEDHKRRNDELDQADAVLEALDSEYYSLESDGIEDLNERIRSFMERHAAECITA